MAINLSPWAFFCYENACPCTFSLSMASSPPGVDMMRSWMLETDCSPAWLHREPKDGDAVRQPIGAVEKWPGRWFSEASKYLCLLLCISFRSEPQRRDRRRKEKQKWWRQKCKREYERQTERKEEKGQRGGKTNVRHTVHIKGLQQTRQSDAQFSPQVVQWRHVYVPNNI